MDPFPRNWPKTQDDYRDFLIERHVPIALVTTAWKSQDAQQLTIYRGEHLEVIDSARNWWHVRNILGNDGFVPCTFVRKIIFEEVCLFPKKNNLLLKKKPLRI